MRYPMASIDVEWAKNAHVIQYTDPKLFYEENCGESF